MKIINFMKRYLVALVLFFHCAFALSAYISEDSKVNYRTGPSTKYRVAGLLDSGTSVVIIDRESSKFFYKIKTQEGVFGWVSNTKIKPGKGSKDTITELQASISKSVSLIKKQANEIHRLKALLNQQKTKNYNQSNRQLLLTSQINTLTDKVDSLDDSNLIRWLTHTGVIAIFLIAMIMLIVTLRKRRNHNHIY